MSTSPSQPPSSAQRRPDSRLNRHRLVNPQPGSLPLPFCRASFTSQTVAYTLEQDGDKKKHQMCRNTAIFLKNPLDLDTPQTVPCVVQHLQSLIRNYGPRPLPSTTLLAPSLLPPSLPPHCCWFYLSIQSHSRNSSSHHPPD